MGYYNEIFKGFFNNMDDYFCRIMHFQHKGLHYKT